MEERVFSRAWGDYPPSLEDAKKRSIERPKIEFLKQPYGAVCMEMIGVNLSVGCDNKCLYCHYEEIPKKKYPDSEGAAVDISPIYKMQDFPKHIYLSPYSEPFHEKTWRLAHELMSFLLPKGIIFWILTKSIIPNKILRLIKKYPKQIEIGVGITNFDQERNSIVEPHCPPAEERLENTFKLAKTGCRYGIRMDPLIPLLDDTAEKIESFVDKISSVGVKELVASYLIVPVDLYKKLKKIPPMKASLKLFRDKSPTTAGMALSIPLEDKKKKYSEINAICKSRGVFFRICGCRELRIKREDADYSIECR